MTTKTRILLLAAATFLSPTLSTSRAADPFVIQDFLNHHWQGEAVSFALDADTKKSAEAGRVLLDEAGKPVVYQIIPGEPAKVLFQTDLSPLAKASFHFGEGRAAAPESDLRIEETEAVIRLTNSRAGISIRRHPGGGEGPIEGIRLLSGRWGGESRLEGEQPLTSWTATVTERGPVRARVVCRGESGEGKTWEIEFTLLAGQPEILVEERFSLPGDSWTLSFAERFRPENLYYRSYPQSRGAVVTPSLKGQEGAVFQWVPWSPWWVKDAGKWFGVYDVSDFLMFGVRDSEVWISPETEPDARAAGLPKVTAKEDVLSIRFPLDAGERHWLIATVDRTASLASVTEKTLEQAPLPQKSVIRQEFPLDRIKDEVLQWDSTAEQHPHLLISKTEVEALRNEAQPPAKPARDTAITSNTLNQFLPYYLQTGDAETGEKLAQTVMEWAQESVNAYFEQTSHYSFGFAPHHSQGLIPLANLADVVLGSGLLSEEQAARLRAQIAFLSYTVARPDFWSPERGFAANPNMTTFVSAYRVALGAIINSHPEARQWVQRGLTELKRQLDEWSDSGGGWLEAPHYAMASYHFLQTAFLMARNSGFENHTFDPKMKKVLEWFAKISTPPDPRIKGWRHHPPIGNTYRFEPGAEYGIAAGIWKDHDPTFAANLRWMHEQQGNPDTGIGGAWPTLAGYRPLFLKRSESLTPKAPDYGSELFPETGVVLRNRYNTGNETLLYMIAGSHYQHYDYDSGSITLWGKGEPIADDFGYNGRMPVADHSAVESPYSDGLNMRIQTFAPAKEADYVHGKLGQWSRQILFVKDDDPMAPNYFFIADNLLGKTSATWRLWLAGPDVKLTPQGAVYSSKGRVDADIQFLYPADAALSVEPRTHETYGLGADGKYAKQSVTLNGLTAHARTARFDTVVYPRLKEEKPPVITSLADGRGVRVVTTAGTDYLFLSDKPFQFKDGPVEFEGTAGVIRLRENGGTLLLGEKGMISYKGKKLESDKAAQKSL